MVKKPMTELPCPFPDCFSCPHPDCIRGSVAGHERPRRTSNAKRGASRYAPLAGLTPEERKAHDKARRKAWEEKNRDKVKAYQAAYRDKNREAINQKSLDRYYRLKEEKNTRA